MPGTDDPRRAVEPLGVVGFGHPLLDISSHVDSQFLEKYDVSPGQTMLATPAQLPVYQEVTRRADVEHVPGGATMNAIRVCQWLLPGACSFSGTIGDDEVWGKYLGGKKWWRFAQHCGNTTEATTLQQFVEKINNYTTVRKDTNNLAAKVWCDADPGAGK